MSAVAVFGGSCWGCKCPVGTNVLHSYCAAAAPARISGFQCRRRAGGRRLDLCVIAWRR